MGGDGAAAGIAGTNGSAAAARAATPVVWEPPGGAPPSRRSSAWKRWTSRSTEGFAGARNGPGTTPIATMNSTIGTSTNHSRTERSGRCRLCGFSSFPKNTRSTRSSM